MFTGRSVQALATPHEDGLGDFTHGVGDLAKLLRDNDHPVACAPPLLNQEGSHERVATVSEFLTVGSPGP